MAVGDVIPKKIKQVQLGSTLVVLYTTPNNMRTQVTEIWIDNQNTSTQRLVDLHAHGTANTNRLAHRLPIAADTNRTISDCKIVLDPNDVLAMKQDTGSDVVVTIYGYEEQIS
jgi:hypothetical protein